MLLEDRLNQAIARFVEWHRRFGDTSYDRMDYWSSRSGVFTKRLFYRCKTLGAPFAAWGLLLENFLPSLQKLYGTPKREAIGDGHFAMAYLDLFERSGDRQFLDKAESYIHALLETATPGYSGLCWGYSFGWETPNGFWPPRVPLITITPYAFWALLRHFEVTRSHESYERALSSAKFALRDLNERKMPNGTFCSSYSPTTYDVVINANTYRAAMLLDAWALSGRECRDLVETAARSIDFVLSVQGSEGEWYYEAKPRKDTFIDHFHTCMVLRNLHRCYLVTGDRRILEAVERGYAYYQRALFHKDGRPKHFAVSKYPKLRKYEMYDYAEAIKLGIQLRDDIPSAFQSAQRLAGDLLENFQTPAGHFLTRVTALGTRHRVPYLRWPQAQIFLALTRLQRALD